jgi:uracil-DNA glycosylase
MINRCPSCPSTHRCVQPDGPTESPIVFIGERPGGDENKHGRPFIGKSGREFNENYLWLAGLRREDIYITNTVLCGADGNRKPTDKEIQGCGRHHIPDELAEINPSIVVLMGGVACSIATPEINLDIEHGIPRMAEIWDWEGIVVPMYHPAAGLHDTAKMIPLLEDFERLKDILEGSWEYPVDRYPVTDYSLISSTDQLSRYLRLDRTYPFIAFDTERHGSHPFSWQISHTPGTGRMVMCGDDRKNEDLMNFWLSEQSRKGGGEVILHNAPQDLDWMDRMGLRVNRFRDTMQESYHLGNLPQGLKGLAYRLLGIRMTTYQDVVLPHSREAMVDWLGRATAHVSEFPYVTQKQLKTKIKTIIKPNELERGLSRIYKHTIDSPTYNPWDKVEELFEKHGLSEKEMGFVESTRRPPEAQQVINHLTGNPGPYPIVGIANVPLGEAVRYGCADADMTLRVELELGKRRGELMGDSGSFCISEIDVDK